MAVLALRTAGSSPQGVGTTAGWDTTATILLLTIWNRGFGRLLRNILSARKATRRAKQTAADLDSAVAELGAQRSRAASLERRLSRQEAFIERNVLAGPEAYSAASPEVVRHERSSFPPCRWDGTPVEDLFVVGSDVESVDGGEDDGDLCRRSCTPPVAAVRVRRSAIKTIDLPPRGGLLHNQGCSLEEEDTTVSRGRQHTQASWFALDEVEALADRRNIESRSQQPDVKDPQAQIERYWQAAGQHRASAKAGGAGSPNPPAEVDSTAAEADRAVASAKEAGSIDEPWPGCSSHLDGPDTPESSMPPSPRTVLSMPSMPISRELTRPVSRPGFVAIRL
ncbi:hypothetical protein N658DRAFT_497375 [Parathielavia hyrcaniae]|uniref:Uncharacterized protein n=1 Tax=Parathielavia hyrcaniae TaxID=113614 RepID=A0AAN6T193_9PEZI|nr:hypothetical protein N658DRAFT_497375 [Parathielavia hyrcaniae]